MGGEKLTGYIALPMNAVEEQYECPHCHARPYIPLHNSIEFEGYRPLCWNCGEEIVKKEEAKC